MTDTGSSYYRPEENAPRRRGVNKKWWVAIGAVAVPLLGVLIFAAIYAAAEKRHAEELAAAEKRGDEAEDKAVEYVHWAMDAEAALADAITPPHACSAEVLSQTVDDMETADQDDAKELLADTGLAGDYPNFRVSWRPQAERWTSVSGENACVHYGLRIVVFGAPYDDDIYRDVMVCSNGTDTSWAHSGSINYETPGQLLADCKSGLLG